MTRLTLRLDFANGERLGPGKVALLEAIARTGSISAAGRSLGMSYRRAWELVDSLNRTFSEPLVATRHGGERGGGAQVTLLGRDVLATWHAMHRLIQDAVAEPLARLEDKLIDPAPADGRDRARWS